MMPMAEIPPPMSWGGSHQVCKSHVKRNSEALIDELRPWLAKESDGSLLAIGMEPAQAGAAVARFGELVESRQPEQGKELEERHRRSLKAAPPKKGSMASLASGLRLLFLDRWNLWRRLTRSRKWRGPNGEQWDGTTNACERAIGWWIKERYRTMRADIGAGQYPTRQPPSGLVRQLSQQGRGRPGTAAWVSERNQAQHTAFPSPSLIYLFPNNHHSTPFTSQYTSHTLTLPPAHHRFP
jgi:hypothetical protein